ncbi:MAG TPA: sigma-70 family RNA polymerase sigma factor [Fibrobacter sp.]|nr:sigma-70 family RNA polymerase sigma factor [Fibrobacter sp.]
MEKTDENLKNFLKEVRGTPVLSRAEENLLFKLVMNGSREAKDKLVEANIKFATKVALQYKCVSLSSTDLINEGAMGLIRAIESFDPSRGLKFISYAVWWIRAYITRAIYEQDTLIRLPSNQRWRLNQAKRNATDYNNIEDNLKVLMQMGLSGVSIDSPISNSTTVTFADVIATPNYSADEDSRSLISVLKNELSSREYMVMIEFYGLNTPSPKTLGEIAKTLTLSRERVRQLRNESLLRVRKAMSQTASSC